MKKPFLLVILFTASVLFSFSQDSELLVKSGKKGLYLEHKVASKENFYSIGRKFNVHPKHLAAFNGLDMGKALNLGQLLNIPLTDTNFSRESGAGTPVYYKTSAKQTVAAISTISRTPVSDVREWNHLSGDNVPAGKKLVIGYFIDAQTQVAAVDNVKNDSDAKPVAEEKKETEAIQPEQQSAQAVNAVKIETAKEEPAINTTTQSTEGGNGYFKAYFIQQEKTVPLSKDETATSGVFKTTSGWSDEKYYALIDGIEPGTIIRVANPANGKAVYAKVLGQMSGIRQNQGLDLRISNAAASILEIAETDKFVVKVNY